MISTTPTKRILRAIAELVFYLQHDEERHFEEMAEGGEDVSTHIFNSVQIVRDWLDEQPGDPLTALAAHYWAELQAEDTRARMRAETAST